jgi:hypothetical protein
VKTGEKLGLDRGKSGCANEKNRKNFEIGVDFMKRNSYNAYLYE